MERNREGYLVGEAERECTACGILFPITSRMTLCKVCNSSRVKSYPLAKKMWQRAKTRSAETGKEFTITAEDVVIPAVCPVFGIPLVENKGRSGAYINSPSLDRIDNTKGYVPGNVRVISQLANAMKGAATNEQLVQFAKWVLSEIPAKD